MLSLHLNDLVHEESTSLAGRIPDGGQFRLTMTVSDQYQASSKRALADGWLRTWYMAESLAECAEQASCHFAEGECGEGEFNFTFSGVKACQMAECLIEFAAAFDPDDLESRAFIYDAAAEWLEKRGAKLPRFPELEEAYHDDLGAAKEFAEEYGEDDED